MTPGPAPTPPGEDRPGAAPSAPPHHDGEVACSEVQRALSVLGRSWAGAVLWSVLGGARRYGEIRAELPGISDAVLSARLRELCAHGLLERSPAAGAQAATYAPTEVGHDARAALAAVRDLTRRHPRHFAPRSPG